MNQKCCPFAGDVGLLLIRIALAVVFIYHGYGKITDIPGTAQAFHDHLNIPMPMLNATLAALAEFGGGILLAIGLLTRFAAIPMTITMAVAVFHVHWGAYSIKDGGIEYAMTLGLILIAVALLGPGRLSLDHLLFRKWCSGKSCSTETAETAD